jgi:hypothetical protein
MGRIVRLRAFAPLLLVTTTFTVLGVACSTDSQHATGRPIVIEGLVLGELDPGGTYVWLAMLDGVDAELDGRYTDRHGHFLLAASEADVEAARTDYVPGHSVQFVLVAQYSAKYSLTQICVRFVLPPAIFRDGRWISVRTLKSLPTIEIRRRSARVIQGLCSAR